MRLLIGGLSTLLLSACGHAADCSFQPFPLRASLGAPDIFVGQGLRISVRFTNENPDIAEPDAFPEPPVVISDSVSGKSCSIEDGGIWARDPLYLSVDEIRLLTYEFSSSNAELVAYDRDLQDAASHGHLRTESRDQNRRPGSGLAMQR